MFKLPALLLLATLCLGCVQAQDMSGTWKLNVEKSDWRGVRKPLSVVVTVEHREAILKYSGWVTYPDNPPRGFSFDGAIDGKPHGSEVLWFRVLRNETAEMGCGEV